MTTIAVLTIGQSYQGGIIVYLDHTQLHGLIAAPYDQSSGIQWSNGSYVNTGATATAIGTGYTNTSAIVKAQGAGSYAAKLCDELVLNGYSDWYLPAKDELNQLYLNKSILGDFSDNAYWSSSEYVLYSAWRQHFGNGLQNNYYKNTLMPVRAVRSF